MPKLSLPATITKDMLKDFTVFGVKNSDYVNNEKLIKDLEASDEVINFIIRTEGYTPYAHLDVDGKQKIGYNLTIDLSGNGLTEQQAYSIFIEQLKIAERKLKKLLPLETITQSQYDALLSLYYRTGDFKSVGTTQRKFKIYDYIKEKQWDYVATALIEAGNNRNVRQGEAKLLMTGDYGVSKDRAFIKSAALKTLERIYPNMMSADAVFQAERVYFVETGRFLPGIDQARKRLIKNS